MKPGSQDRLLGTCSALIHPPDLTLVDEMKTIVPEITGLEVSAPWLSSSLRAAVPCFQPGVLPLLPPPHCS